MDSGSIFSSVILKARGTVLIWIGCRAVRGSLGLGLRSSWAQIWRPCASIGKRSVDGLLGLLRRLLVCHSQQEVNGDGSIDSSVNLARRTSFGIDSEDCITSIGFYWLLARTPSLIHSNYKPVKSLSRTWSPCRELLINRSEQKLISGGLKLLPASITPYVSESWWSILCSDGSHMAMRRNHRESVAVETDSIGSFNQLPEKMSISLIFCGAQHWNI